MTTFILGLGTIGALAQSTTEVYQQYRRVVPVPSSDLPAAQRAATLNAIAEFVKKHPSYSLAFAEQTHLALLLEQPVLLQQSLQRLETLQQPADATVYHVGAQQALNQKKYPLALKILQQSKAQHGPSADLFLLQAAVYRELDNATAALQALQQARKIAPNNAKALYALAQTYQRANPSQSIQLYKQLLSFSSHRSMALAALGSLYWRLYQADPGPKNRPNLEQAAIYYRQYAQLNPKEQPIKQLLTQLDILLAP